MAGYFVLALILNELSQYAIDSNKSAASPATKPMIVARKTAARLLSWGSLLLGFNRFFIEFMRADYYSTNAGFAL